MAIGITSDGAWFSSKSDVGSTRPSEFRPVPGSGPFPGSTCWVSANTEEFSVQPDSLNEHYLVLLHEGFISIAFQVSE